MQASAKVWASGRGRDYRTEAARVSPPQTRPGRAP